MRRLNNSRHEQQIVPRKPREVSPIAPLPYGLQGVKYSDEYMDDLTQTQTGQPDQMFDASDKVKEVHLITVAAFDAPDDWKRGADYVCDGVNDRSIIYDAIYHAQGYNANTDEDLGMYLPNEQDPANTTVGEYEWYEYVGGVRLSPGRFILDGSLFIDIPVFEGSGPSSLIVFSDDAYLPGLYWDYDDNYSIKPILRDFSVNMYNHPTRTAIYTYGGHVDNRGTVENITVYGGAQGMFIADYMDARNCHFIGCLEYGLVMYDYSTAVQCTTYNCRVGIYNYGVSAIVSEAVVICNSPLDDAEPISWIGGTQYVGILLDGNSDSGVVNSFVEMSTNLTDAAAIYLYSNSVVRGCTVYGGNATVGSQGDYESNKGIVLRGASYETETYDSTISDCYFNWFGGYSIFFDPGNNRNQSARAIITDNYFYDSGIGGSAHAGALITLKDNFFFGDNFYTDSLRKYFVEVDGAVISESGNIMKPGGDFLGLIKFNSDVKPTVVPQVNHSDVAFANSRRGNVVIDSDTGARYRIVSNGGALSAEPAGAAPPGPTNEADGNGSTMSIVGPELVKGDTLVLFVMTRNNAPSGLPSGAGWELVLQVPFNGHRFSIYKKVAEDDIPQQTYTLTNSGGSYWSMSIGLVQGLGDVYDYDYVVHESTNIAPAVASVRDGTVMRFWGHINTSFRSYGGGWKHEGPGGDPFLYQSISGTYSQLFGLHHGSLHEGTLPPLEMNNRSDAYKVTNNNFSLSVSFKPKGTAYSIPIGTADGTYDNNGIYLTSPGGFRYYVTVNDDGTLVTSAATTSVSLSARANIVVSGQEIVQFGVPTAQSGSATLTSGGFIESFGATSIVGNATESAIGGPEKTGSASMAGTSTSTSDGIVDESRNVDWTATGAMTTTATASTTAQSSMAGSATTVAMMPIDIYYGQYDGNAPGSGNKSVPVPPETVSGGLLLLFVQTRNSTVNGGPAGWTQHHFVGVNTSSHTATGSTNEHFGVWSKVSDGTETTVTINVTDGGTDAVRAVCVALPDFSTVDDTSLSTTMTGASVSGAIGKPLVAWQGTSFDSGTHTPPSGMTTLVTGSSIQFTQYIVCYEQLQQTGETGTRVFPASNFDQYLATAIVAVS